MTQYHSQYWAHALTLQGADGTIDKLSRSIANARVDLNPHQVDAALFALRSPLSNGAVLADEVGLGKTIEAGIVIAQRWAERRRQILLIVPAALRTQWQQELQEKFFLPTTILDDRRFRQLQGDGQANPFHQDSQVVICSYHYASKKAAEISRVPWDLCVLDEAHRLRNVYKGSSKLARNVADALGQCPKLLLTATPLQNSLMELYGLVSVIDPHVFGDAASFRDQFVRPTDEETRNAELRKRLEPLCKRTLRHQVVEYIPFTNRVPITQEFTPNDAEQELYEEVSEYLSREDSIALPASQRQLITLVLRKLLASSTFAIGGTLRGLISRLESLQSKTVDQLLSEEDLETVDEISEEWPENGDDDSAPPDVDPKALRNEIAELRRFAELADSIKSNAKGEALIPALKSALDQAEKLGAQRKAVIFTESRRTQQYLFNLLNSNGYAGQLVTISGVNNDPESKAIYERWKERHAGDETVTGSKAVDMKTALVEEFRDRGTILIATEAAAEGVNLQFCSLVVNYDLPWNPQRIEQRIGRCHRYGQQHDVVVLNFLNRRNEADQRVFELLRDKFRLFDGVFGASDEVLGALESGVDLERRIAEVYQNCRTPDEIQTAFDSLRQELDEQIQARLAQTRQVLLENFDEDVHERLRMSREKTLDTLSQRERWLLGLTRVELDGQACFEDDVPRFHYRGEQAHAGSYHLDWKQAERNGDIFYRQDHPLAARLIDRAKQRDLEPAAVRMHYSQHPAKISILEPLVGRSGWLELSKLTIQSLDTDEYLILAAMTDDGEVLDQEVCERLMMLPACADGGPAGQPPDLSQRRQAIIDHRLKQVEQRNAGFFDEEVTKLDRWSDDLKHGLEREIKDLDKQIKDLRREASIATDLTEKLSAQKHIRDVEKKRSRKRKELYEAQDAIDRQRDQLIEGIEQQLEAQHTNDRLYAICWTLD